MPSLPARLLPPPLAMLAREAFDAAMALPRAALLLAELMPALLSSLEKLTDLHDELEALARFEFSLQKLADLQDELEQLGRLENALIRIAGFDVLLRDLAPSVKQLAVTTEALPDLAEAAGTLPQLTERVQGVEKLVDHIDDQIDELVPLLQKLAGFAGTLEGEIDQLGDSLEPISRLAERMPGNRRRRKN